ncbi:MAG TPA: hypothetical protein VGE98_13445 [Thermoanaerobaculia bacterium]
MSAPETSAPAATAPPSARRLYTLGLLLFLFIPLVLFLFVVHPRSAGVCLAAGVILIVLHRRIAVPYMERALPVRCVWCGRVPPRGPAEHLALAFGRRLLSARCCAGHRAPAARFFAFVQALRWPLRLGIFAPLLLLLLALLATALGRTVPLARATALFQLVIGVTVNVAALGVWTGREPPQGDAVAVPFPVHNFFLLGVRTLLWIFRLVGIWWIVKGLLFFFG